MRNNSKSFDMVSKPLAFSEKGSFGIFLPESNLFRLFPGASADSTFLFDRLLVHSCWSVFLLQFNFSLVVSMFRSLFLCFWHEKDQCWLFIVDWCFGASRSSLLAYHSLIFSFWPDHFCFYLPISPLYPSFFSILWNHVRIHQNHPCFGCFWNWGCKLVRVKPNETVNRPVWLVFVLLGSAHGLEKGNRINSIRFWFYWSVETKKNEQLLNKSDRTDLKNQTKPNGSLYNNLLSFSIVVSPTHLIVIISPSSFPSTSFVFVFTTPFLCRLT